MSSAKPAAAATAAMFALAAASAFSFVDGAPCEAHAPILAQMCLAQSSRPSPPCCAAVFAAYDEAGQMCLCSVPDSPYGVTAGFNSRYFLYAYIDCGGTLPMGTNLDRVCLESEQPDVLVAAPPPALLPLTPPPPQADSPPPPTHTDEPAVSPAPWYAPHIMKGIYIGGGIVGAVVLFLFLCIHRGGAAAETGNRIIDSALNMGWFYLGQRRRNAQRPSRIGFQADDGYPHSPSTTDTSRHSPPSPRLRPAHRTSDHGGRPPGGGRWR